MRQQLVTAEVRLVAIQGHLIFRGAVHVIEYGPGQAPFRRLAQVGY